MQPPHSFANFADGDCFVKAPGKYEERWGDLDGKGRNRCDNGLTSLQQLFLLLCSPVLPASDLSAVEFLGTQVIRRILLPTQWRRKEHRGWVSACFFQLPGTYTAALQEINGWEGTSSLSFKQELPKKKGQRRTWARNEEHSCPTNSKKGEITSHPWYSTTARPQQTERLPFGGEQKVLLSSW